MRLPQTKYDVDIASALCEVPVDDLTPYVPGLLEWLQDINWPVATPACMALSRCGESLIVPIREIFESNDNIWKYWIITRLLNQTPAITVALLPDLLRLRDNPTPGELSEDVNIAARDLINLRDALLP